MTRVRRWLYLLPLFVLLGACVPRSNYPPPYPAPDAPPGEQTSGSEQSQPPLTEPDEPTSEPPPPRVSMEDVSGAAVVALITRSEQRVEKGAMDSAAASLERALDLEPRNPFVYQRLAALRLEQGQPEQAEALARKSNSLAGNNPYIKTDNWRIIAQTRSMRGDTVGESVANSRVQYYQGRSGGSGGTSR